MSIYQVPVTEAASGAAVPVFQLNYLGIMVWLGSLAMGQRQADREQRRIQKEASEAAAKDPRQIAAGATIGKHYGYARFPALFIHGERGANIPKIVADLGTMYPTRQGGDWVGGTGVQTRLEQFVCSTGDIDIDEVLFNGKPIGHADNEGYVAIEVSKPGESSEMATAFTGGPRTVPTGGTVTGNLSRKRNAQATFDGATGFTMAVNHDPGNVTILGTPTVEPMGRGAKVRTITESNELSEERTFRFNLSDVLLDFFLDEDAGLGMDVRARTGRNQSEARWRHSSWRRSLAWLHPAPGGVCHLGAARTPDRGRRGTVLAWRLA